MSPLRLFNRLWFRTWFWWQGRDFLLLLGGLPALSLGAAAAVLSLFALLSPLHELDASYLGHARHAFKERDYATALLCYERLAPRAESRPDILYGLGQAAFAMGRVDQALALMQHLAPRDEKGYGEAHLWWGWHLLMSQPRAGDAERTLAERHLLRALEGDLKDRGRAHSLLGEIYLAKGNLEQAEIHLGKVIQQRPQLRLRLALLHAQRGNKDRARSEALLVVNHFRPRAQADVNNHFARLAWADATTFLEDYPAAVAILQEGLNGSNPGLYRETLARVYIAWHDAQLRDSKSEPGLRLNLLEKGLAQDAKNTELLNRLLAATQLSSGESDRARDMLHELVARGEGSAAVHFALAADAWRRGHKDQARVHVERAFQIAPHLPIVANNLAWTLAHQPEPDLSRALELSEAAIKQEPNNKNFRDTRGRILAKLGRWQEALPDLEASLVDRKDEAELHLLLAEAYEKIGVPAIAAAHRRLATPNPRSPDR